MFSLRDLRFLLMSLYLDVLRSQRIIGFSILITHNSTRSDHMDALCGRLVIHSFVRSFIHSLSPVGHKVAVDDPCFCAPNFNSRNDSEE